MHSELETARKELLKANKNIEIKDEQLKELKVKNVRVSKYLDIKKGIAMWDVRRCKDYSSL